MNIPYREYIVMTTGEIEDLAALKAVDSGAYDEVFDTSYFPDVR